MTTEKIKYQLLKFLSLGTYPEMEENKKLAIQLATFTGFSLLVTLLFHFFFALYRGHYPLYYFYTAGAVIVYIGLWCLVKRHYDTGRFIIHLVAIFQVFITADAVGGVGGYEYYYFLTLMTPFVVFSIEERKKGFVLSGLAATALIVQQLIGTGLIFPVLVPTPGEGLISVIVVIIFMVSVLSVARWQMVLTLQEIKRQQGELVHSSNLIALGEMSAGIAHEINNPLQTLSFLNESLKRYLAQEQNLPTKVQGQLETMDKTIFKISAMIRGLRELSRDVSNDPIQAFYFKDVIEDVINISGERLKFLGIKVDIQDFTNSKVKGHFIRASQVLINLLNNSIDALESLDEKWIKIELREHHHFIAMSVTDAGLGIPKHIVQKMMQPFFTTKGPGRGTGLGLSISKSIIEKSGGKFYYDPISANTRFVIELPVE